MPTVLAVKLYSFYCMPISFTSGFNPALFLCKPNIGTCAESGTSYSELKAAKELLF
jgi:hypothetical protein